MRLPYRSPAEMPSSVLSLPPVRVSWWRICAFALCWALRLRVSFLAPPFKGAAAVAWLDLKIQLRVAEASLWKR